MRKLLRRSRKSSETYHDPFSNPDDWVMDVDISSDDFAWELEIAMIISDFFEIESPIYNKYLDNDDMST